MVFVEIGDETLRTSFALFLDARFGGSVFDRDSGLELDLGVPGMPPSVQLRLAERLLWAWQVDQDLQAETEVTLTATPFEADAGSQPAVKRVRLRLG